MSIKGRPSFKPTPAQRKKVAIGAATGMPHDAIAAAIGITCPTLRKHFAEELYEGSSTVRLEMVQTLYTAGREGNVSAAKAFVALCDKGNAPVVPPSEKQPKLGKKEQAQETATVAHVGTEWADLLSTGSLTQ